MRMKKLTLFLTFCLAAGGCRPQPSRTLEPQVKLRFEPLAIQQARAYPETVTKRFVSLGDFENSPLGPGHRQLDRFTVRPADGGSSRKFVVNITRTGAGSMRVTLAPKSELIFDIPDIHNFTGYSLLSVALYGESLRDDLRVTLDSDGGSWTSHRTLVRPGWNTVLIDIQRLARAEGFTVRGVRKLRLQFADAAGSIRFNIDDIMLIDNRRGIIPTPQGISLQKAGLDFALALPGRRSRLELRQCADGLWRLGEDQPVLQLDGPSAASAAATEGERIGLMGRRRVGCAEVLENNPLRVRLAATWYFPTRAGELVSLAIRRIRWEYTFYADGRRVTHVELNNSGGRQIAAVRILLNRRGAFSDGSVGRRFVTRDFPGPVGRWSWIFAPDGDHRKLIQYNYIKPGRLVKTLAADAPQAGGDRDKDGFDESQGCYFLSAKTGHCRFTIVPPAEGLIDPVFRVAGKWRGAVSVSSEGLPVRNVVRLSDGSVIFALEGSVNRPTHVEVTGTAPML